MSGYETVPINDSDSGLGMKSTSAIRTRKFQRDVRIMMCSCLGVGVIGVIALIAIAARFGGRATDSIANIDGNFEDVTSLLTDSDVDLGEIVKDSYTSVYEMKDFGKDLGQMVSEMRDLIGVLVNCTCGA